MNEISLEQKVILVSTRTICELFDQENWSDLVALYMFYHKQCKLQKTNQSFTTSNFAMKWLSWWDKRFKDAKKVLKELMLIEDIVSKNDKWIINWWFIKLNYIESLSKANLSSGAETHPVDESTGGWQKTNAWSIKDINAWSIKEETAESQIEEKNSTEKPTKKISSSIRKGSKPIREVVVPPEKQFIDEVLWQKRWVDKLYEILTLPNMKDYDVLALDDKENPRSFTKIISLYEWLLAFFQEKYDGKIYKDENGKMVGSGIILNELDKFIAYYSEKRDEEILDIKARLRKWVTNSLKYAN